MEYFNSLYNRLEGLYISEFYLKNKSKTMYYNIIVTNASQVDLSKFK